MKIKNNSAIALILTVGILAILALIAVGFSAFTRLELRATENFVNLLKAELLAEAGIARAIADLKYHNTYGAKVDPYDTELDPWYYASGVNTDLASASSPSYGSDINYGGGSYRLKVIDCAALININCALPDADAESDLENMLKELGLASAQAQNLIAVRKTLPGGVFSSKEEIKLVSGIGQARYEAIKDFITLWGDDDDGIIDIDKSISSPVPGHSRKSFVNINTASIEVLRAVIRPMIGSNTQADNLADAIKTRRATNPFDGLNPDSNVNNFLSARGEFDRFLEYAASSSGLNIISTSSRDAIMFQSDPNSYSTNSTKIGFDANGYYEIESLGKYLGAEKRVKQAVLVFRRIYQTTKDEFSSNSSDVTRRISWKDSCPVDFTVLKAYSYADDPPPVDNPDPADFIEDSLKLGFWDNFSEDYDPANPNPDASGVLGPWTALVETFTINASGDGMLRTWAPGGASFGIDYFPKIELDRTVCIVDDFAMILHGADEVSDSKYPGFRPDLPWPAVPLGWPWAPDPDASNCPDIANGIKTVAEVMAMRKGPAPYRIHQQYLNTLHVRFGGIQVSSGNEWMSAIFCNNVQDVDLLTGSIPVYQNWVNYDGSGYIYFTPSPPIGPGWELWFQTCVKPYSVISGSNVMVSCNQWWWFASHCADDGTEYFPIAGNAYQREKTFHLKGIGRWHTRGEVYFNSAAPTSFTTTERIMVEEDRYFQIAGMGNLPDVDYFRVVPEQGVYTSNMFNPSAGLGLGRHLEWGTIRAHVSLPAAASSTREPVYLTVYDSAVLTVPEPDSEPDTYIMPSGGAIGITSSQSIAYQAYLFSDKGETVVTNTDFEQAPVVEDVTMTYLPKTQVLYQSKI